MGLLWDAGSLFGAKHYEPHLFAEENAAPVVFAVRPRYRIGDGPDAYWEDGHDE